MRKKIFFLFSVFLILFSEEFGVGDFELHSFPLLDFKYSNNIKQDIEELNEEEIHCLALNVYFEAGIENEKGKKAVAHVTINRVKSENFPNSICEVVKQAVIDWRGNPVKNKCQFSWFCDYKPDVPWKGKRWQESQSIAKKYVNIYYNNLKYNDLTQGSLYYHAEYVNPYWAKHMKRSIKIGKHIFYK
jgi:spore germination cell wall hydrolase CwlJ-like protein